MSASPNSYDLLRLLAAWAVLFGHQYALLGLSEPVVLGHYGWGELGISVFFFLSGALVWSSWCRDPHWQRFLMRRSLRIFPALWTVVILSMGVLGPAISRLTLEQYWTDPLLWAYFKTMLLNNQKGLPGVFELNPLPEAVNGSLWSLTVEFQAYLLVIFVGLAVRSKKAAGAVVLLSITVCLLTTYFFLKGYTKPHYEVLILFGAGAVWGQWKSDARTHHFKWPGAYWFVLPLACVALVLVDEGLRRAGLVLVTVTLVTLFAAGDWGQRVTARWGDISYGVYIYAFPVQQTLVLLLPEAPFLVHLALSTGLAFALGYVSWHVVEKPMLKLKPRATA